MLVVFTPGRWQVCSSYRGVWSTGVNTDPGGGAVVVIAAVGVQQLLLKAVIPRSWWVRGLGL